MSIVSVTVFSQKTLGLCLACWTHAEDFAFLALPKHCFHSAFETLLSHTDSPAPGLWPAPCKNWKLKTSQRRCKFPKLRASGLSGGKPAALFCGHRPAIADDLRCFLMFIPCVCVCLLLFEGFVLVLGLNDHLTWLLWLMSYVHWSKRLVRPAPWQQHLIANELRVRKPFDVHSWEGLLYAEPYWNLWKPREPSI